MKKILLLLSITFIAHRSQAQNYVDHFQGQHLIQIAEKILDWSQQPGLISVSEQVVDSMQNQVFDMPTEQWQVDRQKHYLHQAGLLQKEQVIAWQENSATWEIEEQSTFHYAPNQQLEKTIRQQWTANNETKTTQEICVYNQEEQLVKTHQQFWQNDTEVWQDEQVGQFHHYENGLAAGLAIAELNPISHSWEEKDYRAFVYKAEHPWLSEEFYLPWNEEAQAYRSLGMAACIYSNNILKGVDFYHWDAVTKDWEHHGQAVCIYDGDFRLTGLEFEHLLSDGQTWVYSANCRFSWGVAVMSNVATVSATADLHLVFPNPYQQADFIRLRNRATFLDLGYRVFDMQGRLVTQGDVPMSGEWRLPAGLDAGMYVLVVGDDLEEVMVSRKMVVR